MNQIFKWRTWILKICLGCIIASIIITDLPRINNISVSAQSNVSSSDIISLRARINRLEQQINQIRYNVRVVNSRPATKLPIPNQPAPTSRPTVVNPPIVDGKPIGASDPMYERLATLLIELKEDVRNINKRLTEVEQQVSLS